MFSLKVKRSSETIYFLALTLIFWEATFFSTLSWNENISSIMYLLATLTRASAYALFGILFILKAANKRNWKQLFLIFLGLIIVLASYLSKTEPENCFLYAYISVAFSSFYDFEDIIRVYRKNLTICLLAIFFTCIIGWSNDKVVEFSYAVGHSFGTGHPNVTASLISNLALCWIYTKSKEKTTKDCILLLLVALVVWKVTASRTQTCILIMVALLLMLYRFMKMTRLETMLKALRLVFVVVIIASIYYALNPELISASWDSNFLVRFTQSYKVFSQYGVHFFGNDINLVSSSQLIELTGTSASLGSAVIDNAYLRLLLYYGIGSFILFTLGYLRLYRSAARREDYILQIMVTAFLVAGLMEFSACKLQSNFTLFAIMSIMTDNNNMQERYLKRKKIELKMKGWNGNV